jgi:methylmalonyl-CoA/ethylmalonyl-CoA epimerase
MNPLAEFNRSITVSTIKQINHIALIVENLDAALSFWRDTLGIELSRIEEVPVEHSVVAFLPVGETEIELIKPTTNDSGLAKFLQKRGPGMHHICLEVEDIEKLLSQLKEQNIQMINETPLTGTGGKKYAFIHPKSAFGVLIELYEIP